MAPAQTLNLKRSIQVSFRGLVALVYNDYVVMVPNHFINLQFRQLTQMVSYEG